MSTWIKFCGTTCLEDALASMEAGANALGFIFAPSKRRVTQDQAREIIGKLPAGVERIGVFVGATVGEICKIVADADLSGVQLHDGRNASEIYDSLPVQRRASLRIIRTILMQDGGSSRGEALFRAFGAADTWLLDSGSGSGKTFDWQAARDVVAGAGGRIRLIVAGGLTPENVGEAITTFSPWGVDVVSGIEREPGRKDPEKMKAFVAAVRKAERR
ncbi:MAG TPA: phosphoribosylanthranilate isomerase [Candidatus Angelobacter sp.]|nr:phosphoribosylanthranilate isomerase [Candidatus Angelobacter sp.]